MRIVSAVIMLVCLLSGCRATDDQLDRALELRKNILEAESCAFQAIITADYSDALYTFQIECITDKIGDLQFKVNDPESISGITGSISQDNASLTFDDSILAFPMLADGQLTPVSSPWIFMKALRSGYLTACSEAGEGLCIYIDDSYEENPLHLEVYTDQNTVPIHVDIVWQERRVLSLDIQNFVLQ